MSQDIRFYLRPAARVDAVALHGLRTALFAEITPDDVRDTAADLDELIAILTDPGATSIWVADVDGELAGYARADALGAGHERMIALNEIGVRADLRRHGLGTKLMYAAIGDIPAYAQGTRTDAETAGKEAEREFFVAHGFTLTEQAGRYIR